LKLFLSTLLYGTVFNILALHTDDHERQPIIDPPEYVASIDHCVFCAVENEPTVCDSLRCKSMLQKFIASVVGNSNGGCQPCQSSDKASNSKRAHKSGEDMKSFACKMPFLELAEQKCGKDCPAGGTCFNIPIPDGGAMLIDFWGPAVAAAPKNLERASKIAKLFSTATLIGANFLFTYNGKNFCEKAILGLLGISLDGDRTPYQWKELRKSRLFDLQNATFDGNTISVDQSIKEFEKTGSYRSNDQMQTCMNFIQAAVAVFDDKENTVGETIPEAYSTKSKNVSDVDDDNEDTDFRIIVPYADVKQFWEEFRDVMEIARVNASPIPSLSTFRKAWAKFPNARLLRCKGSHKGCDLCNECHRLLRNKGRRWDRPTLDTVLKFKRLHLKQQRDARLRMALDLEEAGRLNDDGQPISAFIEPDAVSSWLGNSPKFEKGQKTMTSEPVIENRTIGVDVRCGPIEGKFLYHLDNFHSKGANVLIEVIRHAQEDLSNLLAERGLIMPRKLKIQFDNSGENKNHVSSLVCNL
jgi:hypothetical protein